MIRRLCLATALLLPVTALSQTTVRDPEQVRIGVYDSRSIAIAFAASKHNPVGAKMAELEKARTAGDTDRVKELEAWGRTLQRRLHFQGFGRVPVDDLLAHVKARIPALLAKHKVIALAPRCDFPGEHVEIVDLSLELAALFEPPAKALKMADAIRKQEPVDLLTLADMKPAQ